MRTTFLILIHHVGFQVLAAAQRCQHQTHTTVCKHSALSQVYSLRSHRFILFFLSHKIIIMRNGKHSGEVGYLNPCSAFLVFKVALEPPWCCSRAAPNKLAYGKLAFRRASPVASARGRLPLGLTVRNELSSRSLSGASPEPPTRTRCPLCSSATGSLFFSTPRKLSLTNTACSHPAWFAPSVPVPADEADAATSFQRGPLLRTHLQPSVHLQALLPHCSMDMSKEKSH